MSLARAWRRQLLGASTAALIVPSAMVAALLTLVLSGAFSEVGVLGQLFVGPSLPGAATAGGQSGSGVGPRGPAVAALPVIPSVPVSASALAPRGGVVHRAPAARPVLTASRGTGVAGGAIGGAGGTVVTVGAGGSGGGMAGGSGGSGGGHGGGSAAGSSPGSGSTSPQPAPPPQPQPQPVDTAVTVVTSVTQQVPAPVGPAVTQTIQAAGSVVDSLIPQTEQP
ncbi:MAG: hypothetical protein WAN22_35630 [Solirubrobacteraceae bacterium]